VRRLRILTDPDLEGAANMARDEALLHAVRQGSSPPTLRFYGWSQPTVSLGAWQRFADWLALWATAGALPVVRRATGGGAILHDVELTYCLVLARSCLPKGSAGHLYRLVHDAIVQVLNGMDIPAQVRSEVPSASPLAQRGIFWCFGRQYRDDVLVGGKKIAGSAQRRCPEAVLQHGSIILKRRFPQQPGAGLSDFGSPPDPAALCEAIVSALERAIGLGAEEGTWLPAEREMAETFAAHHKSAAWLWRR